MIRFKKNAAVVAMGLLATVLMTMTSGCVYWGHDRDHDYHHDHDYYHHHEEGFRYGNAAGNRRIMMAAVIPNTTSKPSRSAEGIVE